MPSGPGLNWLVDLTTRASPRDNYVQLTQSNGNIHYQLQLAREPGRLRPHRRQPRAQRPRPGGQRQREPQCRLRRHARLRPEPAVRLLRGQTDTASVSFNRGASRVGHRHTRFPAIQRLEQHAADTAALGRSEPRPEQRPRHRSALPGRPRVDLGLHPRPRCGANLNLHLDATIARQHQPAAPLDRFLLHLEPQPDRQPVPTRSASPTSRSTWAGSSTRSTTRSARCWRRSSRWPRA